MAPFIPPMANPTVPAIDRLRVHAVELAHALGEVAFGGFDHKVVMIGHLAPGVAHLDCKSQRTYRAASRFAPIAEE